MFLNNKMTPEENVMQRYLLEDYDPSLIDIQVFYEDPRIKQFKTFDSFRNIIKHGLINSLPINYEYESADFINLNQVCLDIAAKNGLTTFVKILLEQGTYPNRVNKTYNRAPIHFATEGGHVDTLEALLDNPMINPNLQNTEHLQTALHIAVKRNDEVCTRLLLKNGASADIPNSEGQTATHLAALNRQSNIVQLIIGKHRQCLNLDAYVDRNNQTARQVINQNLPELSDVLPINHYKYHFVTCYSYDLRHYLIIGDEINFLKNMFVDEDTFSFMVDELLNIATENDLRTAVREILNWLRKKEKVVIKFVVLQAACVAIQENRYAILQKFLNVVPEIANNILVMDACLQLKKLERSHISDWLECMKLMLNQKGVNIRNLKDDESNTPLHYAAKSGYKEAVNLFLNQDSYIGYMNKFNIPPIADIPEDTLSSYLDDCIQMRMDERTKERTIEFNYRGLMPDNVSQTHDLMTRELELFTYIADNSNFKRLLKHPLFSSFLYLKWHNIRHFLLVNLIYYTIFYIVVILYILYLPRDSSLSENEMQLANDSSPSKNRTHLVEDTTLQVLQNINQNNILWFSVLILLLFYISREILQLVCCPWHYIKDLTNYFQVVFIILTIILLCGVKQIGILIILLSTWEFMVLFSQCLGSLGITQRFSAYIVIFRKVFCNFVRILSSPLIFLIIAFALAFHIFFMDSNHPNFSNFFFSLMKTIVMLTGEINIDDISFASHHSVWIRIVLVIFIFFMVIVLMNMLIGLAISDITKILSKAEVRELIYRIRLIAYFENIACAIGESPERCCSFRNPLWILWRSFGSLASRIFLFPHHLRNGKIGFKICDNLNSHDNNVRKTTLKMDPKIIKQAKQIISKKNHLSDNDKIMMELSEIKKAIGIECI